MNSFKYEPINLEGHSFRLLRLCKGDFGNVRCEIIHAYVDDESLMEYEALSYTWGGTYKAHDVEIGGSIMAVTQNLSLALKSLRKTREDRILWVDAICIDQNNDKERGHQVRQMTSIYAKAARVLIWLGPATPETDLVFDAMSQFEKEASKHACRNWKISDKRWQGIASSAHLSNKNGQITLNHRQREGLHDLLTRSWFDRVWIIQEVANARAAKVACGTKSVLARTFALFPYLSKIRPSEHCQAILDIMPGPSRKYSWWAESHDLSTLLLKFRGSHASDPRDKVYALLGMSSDRDSESFPVPDYEKTDIEVAQYAIAFLLHLRTGTRTSHYLRTWTLAELMQHLEHLADEACVEAAGHGDIATVKELLCTGKANPNYKTLDGQTPLLRAAEEGHEAIVKHLIDMGEVKVDTRYGGSSTPLLMAVKNRHHEIVSLLLGSGKVDVNFRGPSDWNSLLYAVTSGHDEMVRLLIERGKADVSVRNRHGQTPLLIAAKGGHETACKIILDSNAADVDIVDYSGWDSLCTAAIRGHEAIVHMLLRTKDANAITSTQRIAAACERALALELLRIHKTGDFTGDGQWWPLPLLWVLQHGSVELFELLLKVDLGSTCLSNILRDRQLQERLIGLAAQIGLAEVVKLLLCATKTNLYGKDDWAAEALRRAAADGDCETITTMNASGRAVALFREVGLLDVAASFGQLAVVEHLLDLGLSTPNGKGLALRAAARRGFLSICQRLLECGDVDVNYAPQEGMSPPLRLAVEGGHAAVVKLLLDTPGIVVDAKDVYLGQTPLALAAKLGHADVVELLLGTGNVDCSTRDHRTGRTPLDHARNGRFEDVCEVLNRYGVSDRSTK